MTVWNKWECDAGNRWVSVDRSIFSDDIDGGDCQFSGCTGGHTIRLMGSTATRDEAAEWFLRVKAKEVSNV